MRNISLAKCGSGHSAYMKMPFKYSETAFFKGKVYSKN